MLRNKKGFTLIELMIVVAIIGILAAIAIPNFLKFQAKSKQSEAKTNLKGIYTAETAYFGENNSYSGFTDINWEPVGSSRYHYTLSGATSGGPTSIRRARQPRPGHMPLSVHSLPQLRPAPSLPAQRGTSTTTVLLTHGSLPTGTHS